MNKPYALWALFLALVPWLTLLRRAPRDVPKTPFAALRLLRKTKRARRRNALRRILVASARSLACVALVALWATSSDERVERLALINNAPIARADARALIVDGADSGASLVKTSFGDSPLSVADYLKLALDASSAVESSETPRFLAETTLSTDFSVSKTDLTRYDLIIFADVSRPTNEEIANLEDFLSENGRALLVWAGGRLDPEEWRQCFSRLGISANLKNVELNDDKKTQRGRRAREEKEFAQSVPDFDHSGLASLPITRAIVPEGSNATAILRDASSGLPIFSRVGKRVYWFGASPEPSFGALAAHPAFPTLAERVARFALANAEATEKPRKNFTETFLWAILSCVALMECALRVKG